MGYGQGLLGTIETHTSPLQDGFLVGKVATPRPSATDLGVDLLARGAKCGRGRSTNL